jgi:nucleoside-diphosphate-sugar epimerase
MDGDRPSVWDFTHVDDVAEGLVRALARLPGPDPVSEFEILNLGTGNLSTRAEVGRELGAARSVEPELEAWDRDVREPPSTPASPNRTESILNWRPGRTVPDGLRSFIDWYRESSMADIGGAEETGERSDPTVVHNSGTRH